MPHQVCVKFYIEGVLKLWNRDPTHQLVMIQFFVVCESYRVHIDAHAHRLGYVHQSGEYCQVTIIATPLGLYKSVNSLWGL